MGVLHLRIGGWGTWAIVKLVAVSGVGGLRGVISRAMPWRLASRGRMFGLECHRITVHRTGSVGYYMLGFMAVRRDSRD